jgi:diamine N-acetyltransferase
MKYLSGKSVLLRALEPDDLDFLFELENNTDVWGVSGTTIPFSRMMLKAYLEEAHRDLYEVKQLRLVICTCEGNPLGLIDLFDFDAHHLRAGVGIIIADPANRGRGYGSEALGLLCEYAFSVLHLHQIYAGVGVRNESSNRIFKKIGFVQMGIRRDWNRIASGYEDEIMYQKINNYEV